MLKQRRVTMRAFYVDREFHFFLLVHFFHFFWLYLSDLVNVHVLNSFRIQMFLFLPTIMSNNKSRPLLLYCCAVENMVPKTHALLVMVPIKIPARYIPNETTAASNGHAQIHVNHVPTAGTLLIVAPTLFRLAISAHPGSIWTRPAKQQLISAKNVQLDFMEMLRCSPVAKAALLVNF